MPSGVCHISTIFCLKWLQKLTSCFCHSKINYYVKVTTTFFLRKNKGGLANVLLLYHGVAGQGIASFKAFPGPCWALSRPATLNFPGVGFNG